MAKKLPAPWENDDTYPRTDWQAEVAAGDTNLGYSEWVLHQREAHGEFDNEPYDAEPPHPTVPVATVTVIDPDTKAPVEVEIRKDKVTGAMVGLDGSWLEQHDDNPCDPYNPGATLLIPDNEEPS